VVFCFPKNHTNPPSDRQVCLWCDAYKPLGDLYGTVFGPEIYTVPGGDTLDVTIPQVIPSNAQLGIWRYMVNIEPYTGPGSCTGNYIKRWDTNWIHVVVKK